MKNLRVSIKLISSFVFVALLAGMVGIVGIVNMNRMDNASTQMYEVQSRPIPYLAKVIESLEIFRVNTREYALGAQEGDSARINEAKASMDSYIGIFEENLAVYDASIVNPEARTLFDEARNLYNNTYKPSLDKCYELAKAGNSTAILAQLTDVRDAVDKMVENFDRCMAIKTEAVKTASDKMTVQARTSFIIIVAVLALAMAAALFLAFYISGLISKPLVTLTDFMKRAGGTGDISLTKEDEQNIGKFAQVRDEIGQCIASCAQFVGRLHEVANALETVADGDLTVELPLLSDRDTMGRSLQTMVGHLNDMFGEINSATSQVTIGSKQIADGAQSLAQGSTEQASAVQQLSASITEIAQKTKENAQKAMHAADLAGNIKQNAEKGNVQMDQMMQAVREINEASHSISNVISVIDNIAFQTNILALNAAVEAARAGQHGKGFAVVAEEVRSLASKSAEAARETGSLIANSMEKAQMGARIADETAASLVEIVSGINESNRIVGDIAQSSNEQAVAITEINTGIDQVAQVIQQNSATAEQSAAASQQMSGQADSLQTLIAQFKLKGALPPALDSAPRYRRSRPEASSFDDGGSGMGKY